MTHKTYTGTLTDAQGREWLPFFLLTAKELEGIKEAGVLPDDIREVTGIEPIADEAVWSIAAKTTIERVKAGMSA